MPVHWYSNSYELWQFTQRKLKTCKPNDESSQIYCEFSIFQFAKTSLPIVGGD